MWPRVFGRGARSASPAGTAADARDAVILTRVFLATQPIRVHCRRLFSGCLGSGSARRVAARPPTRPTPPQRCTRSTLLVTGSNTFGQYATREAPNLDDGLTPRAGAAKISEMGGLAAKLPFILG
jgi:hypothetical protein